MKMPSASMLSRAIACPGSLCLPQLPNENSDAAQRGTEIHSFLANQVDSGQELITLQDETAEYVEKLNIEPVLEGRTVVAAEVTFIYEPEARTATEVPVGSVDYRNSRTVIGGTADLILLEPDGTFVILDWKSGTQVEHPRENKQLLFFALCLRYIHKATKFAGEIAFLDPISAKVTVVRADFTNEQIDLFQENLGIALSRAAAAETKLYSGKPLEDELAEGAHCKYCPSFTLCPRQRHIATAIAMGDRRGLIPVRGAVGIMTAKEAGYAWVRLKELRKLIAQAEVELRAYAEDVPLELPTGGKVQIVPSTRESINAEIARSALTELGGEALRDASSTYTVTKASLKRGFKALGKSPKEVNVLLEIIEDRGGVTVSKGVRLKTTGPTGAEAEDEKEDDPNWR